MWQKTSNFLSYLLHPVFVPTYSIIFVLFFFRNIDTSNITIIHKLMIIGSATLTTIIVPLLLIVYLKLTKYIKSFKMETRAERTYPLAITSFSTLSTAFMLYNENYPYFMFKIVLVSGIIMVAAFFINLKWKISLHTLGMAGLTGIVYQLIPQSHNDIIFMFFVCILLTGILGSVRLKLKAHSPAQIYSAYIIGWVLSTQLYRFI